MARSQVGLDELEPDTPDSEAKRSSSSRSSGSRSRTSARAENELRDRLVACFERIAASLEAREDDRLADIVREDAGIIAQGLVSLTRPFTALRAPLLAAVAIIEPALAFGRILRELAMRAADRRAAAREAAQEQAEEPPYVG